MLKQYLCFPTYYIAKGFVDENKVFFEKIVTYEIPIAIDDWKLDFNQMFMIPIKDY
jgi:hypothetical protein